MSGWLEALLGKVASSGSNIPLSKGLNFTGDLVAAINQSTKQIDVAFKAAYSKFFPGGPAYDMRDFGAVGNGIADDTAAFNAAIAAAKARPGPIYLGAAHRLTSQPSSVANVNNVVFEGRGKFNGGTTIICDSATPIDPFVFDSGQHCGVRNVWITNTRAFTGGWGVRLRNSFRPIVENVSISFMGRGVEVYRCVLADIWRTNLDELYGPYGFLAYGDAGGVCHATRIVECGTGCVYPLPIVGVGAAWATSTAYVVGNVRSANGNIYQCSVSGTSASTGSGPSGIPGSTPGTAKSTEIVDGTCRWLFAMPLNTWYQQESYCHTFEVIDCGGLQGGYGLQVSDSSPAGGSTPLFTRIGNLQIDHPFSRGIRLTAGSAAHFERTFVTSVQEGHGVEITSAHSGGWQFEGGQIFGCTKAGFSFGKGDGILTGMQISACGAGYSTIEATGTASGWIVSKCIAGATTETPTPATDYGVDIASGCDNFTVEGNVLRGHVQAPVRNNAGGSSTRIVRNNIPASAAARTVDGVEVRSLAPSATPYTLTLLRTTHTVIITPTGAGDVIIGAIVHAGAGSDDVVDLAVCKAGFTGRVLLRDSNVDQTSIWTPLSADYYLTRYNDACRISNIKHPVTLAIRWLFQDRTNTPESLAPIADNAGVQFVIRVPFTAAAAGTADDVTIYSAAAPFAFRIVDVHVHISTAISATTVQLRDTSGGGGAVLSSSLSSAATGVVRNADTATRTVAAAGSVFLRRSDRGVAGEVVITAVRT